MKINIDFNEVVEKTKPLHGVGMFNVWIEPVTKKPYKNYYAYVIFNELYKLKNEVKCVTENLGECRAIAAANDNKGKIVITNPTEKIWLFNLIRVKNRPECML